MGMTNDRGQPPLSAGSRTGHKPARVATEPVGDTCRGKAGGTVLALGKDATLWFRQRFSP